MLISRTFARPGSWRKATILVPVLSLLVAGAAGSAAAGSAASQGGGVASGAAAPDTGVSKGKENPQWGGRLAYLDANGDLWARLHYQPDSAWVRIARQVRDFQMLCWSVAVLKTDGSLWLGDGPLGGPLRRVDENVAAFQLTLTRVGSGPAQAYKFVRQSRSSGLCRKPPKLNWRNVSSPRW